MKRVPALRDLSDDHHTALVLARRCKEAGRPEATAAPESLWEQVLEAFAVHLEPHFQIEESHLLPALDAIGEVSLARRIQQDHEALRNLRDASAPSRDSLGRFGRLLEAHVRFEERQVFEPTQHRLPATALEAIERACETIPRVCPVSLRP